MDKTILSTLCLFLIILTFAIAGESKDCNKLAEKAEYCVRESLFMGKTKVPHTLKAWKSFADVYSNSVKCMKQYQSCLKGLQRQVYGLILSGVTRFGKELFGKQSNGTKELYALQCYDDKLIKKLENCVIAQSSRLQFMNKGDSRGDLFANLCCSLRLFQLCTDSAVKSECKVAVDEAVNFFHRARTAIVGDASDFLCSKQPNLKVCHEQYSQITITLRELNTSNYSNDEFLIRPLIRFIKLLSE